ncbi:class I SAM-dependent methyltransferase [Thermodesulfobacteriota bacterium]
MRIIRKTWYQFLQYQDYMLGVWSCRAMQLRGFSSRPVHPKHLFDEKRAVMLHELFSPGIMFLDLGSGVGSDCLAACDAGAALAVGLEGNLESIRTAIIRSREKGSGVHFMKLDLEQGSLPFANNCFDLVNFSNVLEHLHNRNGILKELKRVKKEDGVGVISIPNADTSWKKKLRAAGLDSMDDPDHKIEYTKKSLAEELGAADLAIESKLMPIIPSFPWNGLIAMSAAVSPKIYRRLQSWKRAYVETRPVESIGWVFVVK